MSVSDTTRERGANGRFFHGEPKPYAGPDMPLMAAWTVVAVLDDANKDRHHTTAGAGFRPVPDAPVSLAEADHAYEHGRLLKANRRNGRAVEVIFRTPLALCEEFER